LPWPDFESGWLPIKNGLEHFARLNIDHGLGEIPVLVDVSVKIKEHIFPASGKIQICSKKRLYKNESKYIYYFHGAVYFFFYLGYI
jgi:hypothetical protein